MSRGKPVENPYEPYRPNRVQITTMLSPEARAILKKIKVEEGLSYGQAISQAVETYWADYAEDEEK